MFLLVYTNRGLNAALSYFEQKTEHDVHLLQRKLPLLVEGILKMDCHYNIPVGYCAGTLSFLKNR